MRKLNPFPKGYCGTRPLTPELIASFNSSPFFQTATYGRAVSEDGIGVLCNAVSMPLKCGCKAIGNGSLQFPMTVQLCAKHKRGGK